LSWMIGKITFLCWWSEYRSV